MRRKRKNYATYYSTDSLTISNSEGLVILYTIGSVEAIVLVSKSSKAINSLFLLKHKLNLVRQG